MIEYKYISVDYLKVLEQLNIESLNDSLDFINDDFAKEEQPKILYQEIK